MAGNATIGALRVVLGLDSAAFTDGLTAAQKHLRGVGRQLQQVGATMATVGAGMSAAITAPLIAAGFAASKAATEAADAMGQVEAALTSMGGASGKTKEQLAGLAEGLMRNSLYDDDDVLRQVTANLLTFGRVAGAEFDRAQQAAVDLATRMKMDLQPATLLVGKALNDPVKGLTALSRAGIQFTAAQKEQIKAMVAAGNVAGAQRVILGELEKQFGGAAAAAQRTDPYDRLRDSLNSLSESVGVILNRHVAPLLDRVAALADRFNGLSLAMQQVAVAGAALVAALGPALVVIGAVVGSIGTLIASPMLPFLLGAAAAVAGVTAAFAIWGKELMPIVQTFGEAVVEAIGPMLPPMVAALKAAFEAMAPVIKFVGEAFIGALGPIVITLLRVLVANVTAAFNIIGQAFRVIGAILRGDWSTAWNAAGSLVMSIVKGIGGIVEAVFPGITETVGRMVTGVTRWLTGKLFDVLRGVIAKVKGVSDAFFRLYDAVVGHSFVPDMVEGVADWMAKLDAVMVVPARRATSATAQAFEDLRNDVAAVMEGLLTDLERAERDYAKSAGLLARGLAAGQLTQGEYDQAMSRLDRRRAADRYAAGAETRNWAGRTTGRLAGAFGDVGERGRDVFSAARAAMGEAADSVSGAMQDVSAEMEAAGDRFAHSFARTFEGLLNGDIRGVLDDVLNSVLRSALLNIGKMLHSWGGQQGGWLGSLFKALPGFATGGSFRVGGRAGTDQNLVAFRATRGEMVDIRRPGQDRGTGGALHFDLRGAVMTRDLLAQMQRMATESGGMAYGAARSTIPAEKARRDRFAYGAG